MSVSRKGPKITGRMPYDPRVTKAQSARNKSLNKLTNSQTRIKFGTAGLRVRDNSRSATTVEDEDEVCTYCTLKNANNIFRVPIHDFMSAAPIRTNLRAIFVELLTVRSHFS